MAVFVDDPALDYPLRCLDGRCATLLPADAELCDECGGAALGEWHDGPALVGAVEDRPVAFPLAREGSTTVGRSVAGEPAPDADLGRLPGAASVHRRHAALEPADSGYRVRHLGRNPLVVQDVGGPRPIEPGGEGELRPGDRLLVGAVTLRFVDPRWSQQVEER
jgi:hypothetical protein